MQTKLYMKMRITLEHSCQTGSMYQLCSVKGKKLTGMFPQYGRAQIYMSMQRNHWPVVLPLIKED